MEIGHWRFLAVRDLWGRTVRRSGGDRIGSVEATVLRPDDGIDLLVRGRRHRVARIPLDDVSVDGDGSLWLRPAFRLVRVDGGDPTVEVVPPAGDVPVLLPGSRRVEATGDRQGLG
jgi:hypothetical protein